MNTRTPLNTRTPSAPVRPSRPSVVDIEAPAGSHTDAAMSAFRSMRQRMNDTNDAERAIETIVARSGPGSLRADLDRVGRDESAEPTSS